MNHIIETDRLVVQMASFVQSHPSVDLYPIGNECVIFLVREQRDDADTGWQIVSALDWAYSAMGQVIRSRATLAEAGQLLPDGRQLKAEQYIQLWREAARRAISFTDMLKSGLTLVSTTSFPTRFLQRVRAGTEPYPKVMPYLDSRHITKADENGETTWTIPLDSLEALMEHAALARMYCSVEDRVADPTPDGFTLRIDAAAATPPGAPPFAVQADTTRDLFEVAV